MQVQSCLAPQIGRFANPAFMAGSVADDIKLVRELVKWADVSVAEMARRIEVHNTTLNRFNKGTATTRLHRDTLAKLKAKFPDFPGFGGDEEAEDEAAVSPQAYLFVEVLPSYAGMGGGGTGDGDRSQALISRSLIEDELRAKPSDLILIEARGESMMPDFHHGDQILIDKRDRDPVQPGVFALWDGDGYVVKLVERVPHKKGFYRVFSANTRFSAYEVAEESVRIMGRPVWFGRRL